MLVWSFCLSVTLKKQTQYHYADCLCMCVWPHTQKQRKMPEAAIFAMGTEERQRVLLLMMEWVIYNIDIETQKNDGRRKNKWSIKSAPFYLFTCLNKGLCLSKAI